MVAIIVAESAASAGSLEGRVTEAGSPLAGATVLVGSRATRTDRDGQYRVDDLVPGDYVVTVYAGDRSAVIRAHVGAVIAIANATIAPPLDETTFGRAVTLTDIPIAGHAPTRP